MESKDLIQILIAITALSLAIYSVIKYTRIEKTIARNRSDNSSVKSRRDKILEVKRKRKIKRYIVFKIYSIRNLSFNEIEKAVTDTVKRDLGNIGMIYTTVKLIKYDPKNCLGILRITGEDPNLIALILSKIRQINGNKVIIAPIRITGSLKKAYKYITK